MKPQPKECESALFPSAPRSSFAAPRPHSPPQKYKSTLYVASHHVRRLPAIIAIRARPGRLSRVIEAFSSSCRRNGGALGRPGCRGKFLPGDCFDRTEYPLGVYILFLGAWFFERTAPELDISLLYGNLESICGQWRNRHHLTRPASSARLRGMDAVAICLFSSLGDISEGKGW